MIYPLLPLYLVDVLGATNTELGALEGSALLLVAFMSAAAGLRSDGTGGATRRVPWIRWGYGLPVLGKALIALAGALPLALAGRLLDRFGKGLRSAPRDALIADAVSEDQRGRAFGLHRALDTAGALVGVLVAALLLWLLSRTAAEGAGPSGVPPWVYRAVISVGAVLGFASLALTWLVHEIPSPAVPASGTAPGLEGASQAEPCGGSGNPVAARIPAAFWCILGVVVIFSLANSSDTFLLLRAREVGLSPVQVVLLYAAFNVSYSLLAYPAGALSDRLGRWRVIALGWVLYALVYGAMAIFGRAEAWTLWPVMVVYGAYMALTEGTGKALVIDHVPATRRGAALGIFYAALGVAAFSSSVMTGFLWDRYGAQVAFAVGAAIAVVALMALAVVRTKVGAPASQS